MPNSLVSEKLLKGQLRSLNQALEQKYKLLKELKEKLNNLRARRKQKEDVEKKVKEIPQGERGPELIKVSVLEKEKTSA